MRCFFPPSEISSEIVPLVFVLVVETAPYVYEKLERQFEGQMVQ